MQCNELLATNLQSREVLFEIADIHFRLRRYKKAMKTIDYMVSIDSKDVLTLYIKWTILMEMGKYEESKERLNKANKDWDNPEIMRCLGVCMCKLNDIWWIDILSESLLKSPYDAQVILDLAQYSAEFGKYELTETTLEHHKNFLEKLNFIDIDEKEYKRRINDIKLFVAYKTWNESKIVRPKDSDWNNVKTYIRRTDLWESEWAI